MTRQDVFSWCRQQHGTEPDYPWKDWNDVLCHAGNDKWYGVIPHQADIIKVTNDILMDVRSELAEKATFNMPIAQLATLGAGVSSLIPALHTVTQTMTVNIQGLFRLANAGVGDALTELYDIFARKKLYDKDLVEQTYKYVEQYY